MTNLHLMFAVAFVAGFVLIWMGASGERQGKEPPPLAQAGYLAVIVGGFGLLAQFVSFAAAMLSFLLVAAGLMMFDRLVWKKKRAADQPRSDAVEYAYSFFPIILIVFLVRSFVAEPFQIPSSSMRPGLIPGDFILVSKFSYGVRLPILNKVVIPTGAPERGDVMVFEFPPDRSTNYIKRVIGLPGDIVEYRDKQLYINGQFQEQQLQGPEQYLDDNAEDKRYPERYVENLGGRRHSIFIESNAPAFNPLQVAALRDRGLVNSPENCQYDMQEARWFRCTVPAGHYFVLGDNRDNSADGRYWGFVPDNHIVGKAHFVWLNLGDFSRVGTRIH